METRKRVTFTIQGTEYTIMTQNSSEHIMEMAKLVDDNMTELAKRNDQLSTLMVSIFTSLNLADELFNLKNENALLKEKMKNPVFDVSSTKEKIDDINGMLEQKNKEYSNIKREFDELIRLTSTYEEDLKSLRGKMNLLSFELENKDLELKESNDRVKYLEALIP